MVGDGVTREQYLQASPGKSLELLHPNGMLAAREWLAGADTELFGDDDDGRGGVKLDGDMEKGCLGREGVGSLFSWRRCWWQKRSVLVVADEMLWIGKRRKVNKQTFRFP